MRFCLEVWGADYERVRAACRRAEALGFDGFYYGESLTALDLDCWTVLAALAECTSRIELGPVVTYLLPGYRSLALLAKQAATLQTLSGGRLAFRTGCGAPRRAAASWWAPYGVRYPPVAERIAALDEGLAALVRLWTEGSCQLSGHHYRMGGGAMPPLEPPPPVTIAARSERMLALAARRADVWEASYLTPQEFGRLEARFRELEGTRRAVRSLELDAFPVDSPGEMRALRTRLDRERGPTADDVVRRSVHGTPSDIAERLCEYAGRGVDQVVFALRDPLDADDLERLMTAGQRVR